MKAVLFLLFSSLCSCVFAQGNFMDTIKINRNNPATLEFPEPVSFTLIGNNPYRMLGEVKEYKHYQISQVDNIVIIEAGKEFNPEISSITIKTASNTFYGYIGYFDSVKTSFYPFAPTKLSTKNPDNPAYNKTEVFLVKKVAINEDTIMQRISQVLALKPHYNHIADIKGKVIFQVANIVNDVKYSYIKLIIQNNSASTYTANGVLFKFEEGKKGIFKKSDVTNTEWLNAVKIVYPPNKSIESYSFANVGIVVPLYNGANGVLMLKVMEANGTRTAVINIKSVDINNTKIF
jgi:hypothetical protein